MFFMQLTRVFEVVAPLIGNPQLELKRETKKKTRAKV